MTFLLVSNLAMWLLNTLETSRTDAHPMMVRYVLLQHHTLLPAPVYMCTFWSSFDRSPGEFLRMLQKVHIREQGAPPVVAVVQ